MNHILSQHFHIPECASPIIPIILREQEQQLICSFQPGEAFSFVEVSRAFSISEEEARNLLTSAYQRNIINISEGPYYQLGSFYARLGTFCQFENDLWSNLDPELRNSLGNWYLQSFIKKTKPLWESNQRPDRVATLEETIQFIEQHEGGFYLTKCDCRSIFGNCNHTLETCIGFSGEQNTSFHRGHARLITKDETIALVNECHQEGLIHTLENYGICNCCTDCCFEYRAAVLCDTIGTWPISTKIVSWEETACIHCGICTKRCPMGAFVKEGKTVSFQAKQCIGCGVCISKCPKSAIKLIPR